MIHRANADFWNDYHALPHGIRALAIKLADEYVWTRRAIFEERDWARHAMAPSELAMVSHWIGIRIHLGMRWADG